ncbi:MAG: hypothetical protein ACO1G9_12155 [Bacteroidota bacterium]
MIETLIALILALGLNFTKTDSGKLSMDSKSITTLQNDERFQRDFSSGVLTDIVVTDDDDPVEVKQE